VLLGLLYTCTATPSHSAIFPPKLPPFGVSGTVCISLPLEGKVGCVATRMRWSAGKYDLFKQSANLLCATSSVTFCDSFPSRGSLISTLCYLILWKKTEGFQPQLFIIRHSIYIIHHISAMLLCSSSYLSNGFHGVIQAFCQCINFRFCIIMGKAYTKCAVCFLIRQSEGFQNTAFSLLCRTSRAA